jgi:hypothetical protein
MGLQIIATIWTSFPNWLENPWAIHCPFGICQGEARIWTNMSPPMKASEGTTVIMTQIRRPVRTDLKKRAKRRKAAAENAVVTIFPQLIGAR